MFPVSWHGICYWFSVLLLVSMKNIILSSLLLAVGVSLSAQTYQPMPQRTPEEEAWKQTAMLLREVGMTDSLQRDTLYRMHLKYAQMRQKSNTRMEGMQRMMAMYKELKGILTPEQYNRFMNKQMDSGPRHPQHPIAPLSHPNGGEQHKPTQPIVPPPANRP